MSRRGGRFTQRVLKSEQEFDERHCILPRTMEAIKSSLTMYARKEVIRMVALPYTRTTLLEALFDDQLLMHSKAVKEHISNPPQTARTYLLPGSGSLMLYFDQTPYMTLACDPDWTKPSAYEVMVEMEAIRQVHAEWSNVLNVIYFLDHTSHGVVRYYLPSISALVDASAKAEWSAPVVRVPECNEISQILPKLRAALGTLGKCPFLDEVPTPPYNAQPLAVFSNPAASGISLILHTS
jgi:hypothetical protein